MKQQDAQGIRVLRKNHNEKLAKRIFMLLKEKGIKTQTVIDTFKEKYGEVLNSGTISNYRNNRQEIPHIFTWEVCRLTETSMDELLQLVENDMTGETAAGDEPDHLVDTNEFENNKDIVITLPASSSIITDPNHPVFRGYLGDYNIYFTPTHSNGEGFLKGRMTFQKGVSEVHARIELYAHKKSAEETEVNKVYEGTLIHSNAVNCCYAILSSTDVGELCFLMLRHFYINNASLKCRLAEVLTASAGGEDKNPTVHRMLISRNSIQDEDVYSLLPLLNLNNSLITIPQEALRQVADSNPGFKAVIDHILSMPGMNSVQCYQIRENTIRSIVRDVDSKLEIPLITAVREKAISYRYNKISKKADDTIKKFLAEKGYF